MWIFFSSVSSAGFCPIDWKKYPISLWLMPKGVPLENPGGGCYGGGGGGLWPPGEHPKIGEGGGGGPPPLTPGGTPLYRWRGCSSENFENTPKRYQNLVLWACPNFISTPKSYQFNNNKLYNWHWNLKSNKDNFRTLLLKNFFESIVNSLYPNN